VIGIVSSLKFYPVVILACHWVPWFVCEHFDPYGLTLRAILRKNRLWAAVQAEVRMLRTCDDVSSAIGKEEETALLKAWGGSCSRTLYPAVLLAINTYMRYSEIRTLRWGQIDRKSCTLPVGQSKTESGAGRLLPLKHRAVAILNFWAGLFPSRAAIHFIVPTERYGASCDGKTVIYDLDRLRPIGRWKEAWESAKTRAVVSCRFLDSGAWDRVSMTVIDSKSKDMVFSYTCQKGGGRLESVAQCLAKHWKDQLEKK